MMEYVSFSNPVYSRADNTAIDVDLVLTEGSPAIAYTAASNDPVSADLFAAIVTKGRIAAYVAPASVPVIAYLPAWLIRQRLTTANLWTAAVAAMTPAQQIEFATLQEGIDPSDTSVIALLTEIGAQVETILAPQTV